tara:strand:- start:126 stop:524 length:399 start_codon:yes stop_codon:yes gene_type:complete
MKKLISILLLSTIFANVTNDGATLTIDSDVGVFVEGDFINNGTLTNAGYLEINGLYLGEGVLTNTGTIIFNNLSGDITADGNINISDIILLVEYILNEYELSSIQLEVADLNQNGYLNVTDVILLIELVLDI